MTLGRTLAILANDDRGRIGVRDPSELSIDRLLPAFEVISRSKEQKIVSPSGNEQMTFACSLLEASTDGLSS